MGNFEVKVVLFFGLSAAVLAIAAEWTKVKKNEVIKTNLVNRYGRRYCEYPRRRDGEFAYVAAGLAFLNMKYIIYINSVAFFAYMNRTAKLPVIAIICFIISGLESYAGVSTLVTGAVISKNQKNEDSPSNCKVFNNGYYISGIVLLAKGCGFGILSYLCLSDDSEQQSTSNQAVEMGKTTLDQSGINESVHIA
ncbi:uncharacterized protein LOC110736064 [Chenopodium quinoa]|uniref:uncharacterized protein LOC110736064 n=1 Tax=Chenopodium quinoa TaxID=63459 RepID=UPI000B781D9E|nr:uncharacterized protein LOC110736064 [Chenopodium quinoa]